MLLIYQDDSFGKKCKKPDFDRFFPISLIMGDFPGAIRGGGDMLNMDGLNSRQKWTTIVAKT